MDRENKTCQFTSKEFQDLLEICNKYCNESGNDIQEQYLNGKALFIGQEMNSVLSIQRYKQLFGEDVSFLEITDGAWEFIRTFLTKEFHLENESRSYMPIRQDCFDSALRAGTATEAYTDERGLTVQPASGTWNFLGMNGETEPATKEAGMYFSGDRTLEETANIIQNRVQLYLNE